MLSGSNYTDNQQLERKKSSNRFPSVSDHEESYPRNEENGAIQGSPLVFIAKITVAQQQQEQTTVAAEGQLEEDGNIEPFLYVEQNDVVSIEQQSCGDDDWYLARSDQQVGRVPKSSCLILDNQIPTGLCQYLIDNQYFNLNVCFASFVAQDVGDLSITKGDIIVAIVPVNEHWVQGQVCFDSQAVRWPRLAPGKQVGTYPLNHCWQLNSERFKTFCYRKVEQERKSKNIKTSTSSSTSSQQIPGWSFPVTHQAPINNIAETRKPFLSIAHSSSLSSGSSSLQSNDHNQVSSRNYVKQQQEQQQQEPQHKYDFDVFHKIDRVDSNQSMAARPPPRPTQLPRQMADMQKSSSERTMSKPSSILTSRQQDKLKSWLQTVKKKTARLSTRITASLGLISLTRDEEFERHYESFKQLEKSIRVFIKNLSQFVEHFENFLVALQNTSDNLADFYRDKAYQREINEMRKKNKALNCEHFHAFKRTVDRQVIAVASQLLQKFAGPQLLVHKRSAKLLDYDTKVKEMDSCRDSNKKASLLEDYVIAKDLYDRINGQLIEELPLFNQFAMDIFRECILVLLESRRNLMLAYTQQTANLLDTPLMASYTAADVASTILMSSEIAPQLQPPPPPPPPPPATAINAKFESECQQSSSDTRSMSNQDFGASGLAGEQGTQPKESSGSALESHDELSRPQSAMSQFSSEFDQMALAAREISSTPLSQLSETDQNVNAGGESSDIEEHNGVVNNVRFDEPDVQNTCYEHGSDGSSDNRHNENIESTIQASRGTSNKLNSTSGPRNSAANVVNNGKNRKRRTEYQIFVASWPFVATGPNQLSIACNQPLKLIKGCDECGNSDWSLVKNKKGHLGYVPTSYIKRK